jgi:hypothetical protein
MAHFAELDESNKVLRVMVIDDEHESDGENWCNEFFNGGAWKQTSYNTIGGVHTLGGTPYRKNYAGVGHTYDEIRDAFIPPKPFSSWVLDEDTCRWVSPVAVPQVNDHTNYEWDEESQQWIEHIR